MAEDFKGATEAQTFEGTVGTHKITGDGVTAEGKLTNPKVGPGPEMNKPTTSHKLSKILPSRSPLDTFLRNIGSGETKSDKYEFYSIISRGVACKVSEDVAISAGSVAKIKLSEGCHALSKDGNLLVPTYNVASGAATKLGAGMAAQHPLILHIVSINYIDKEISVVAVNASSATISAETVMYRMASAKDQDAAISNDPAATPTKDFNFCQRNLCTISENAFQALQEKEVQYGLAEFKEQALLDFRYQSEVTTIFGSAFMDGGEFIDPLSQKRKLGMRGFMDFNIQHIVASAGQSVDQFLNGALEAMFSGNNGSESRLLIYGPGFATKMADSKSWVKNLEASKTQLKWGVTWKEIESNFGVLHGVMNPVLGLLGPYTNCAFIVDPANIRRIDQIKLRERKLDLQAAGIRNTKDVLLEESWTLEVTNPTTHGMISF